MPIIAQVIPSTKITFCCVRADKADLKIHDMRQAGWQAHSWECVVDPTQVNPDLVHLMIAFTKPDEKVLMANVKPVLDEVKRLFELHHHARRRGDGVHMSKEEELAMAEGRYQALQEMMDLLQRTCL